MTVCDLVQFHSPISGGVRRYITDKAKMLQQFSEISHAIIIPGDEDKQWQDGSTRFFQVKSPILPGSKSYRTFTHFSRIYQLLDKINPNLIEVADPYQSAWIAYNWASNRDCHVALFYHSDYPRCWHRTLRRWIPGFLVNGCQGLINGYLKYTLEKADALIVSTQKYERYWKSHLRNNVFRIPFGFDPSTFCPCPQSHHIRDQLGIPRQTPLILFLGRLAREKRVQLLIQAFVQLKAKIPEAQLLIVGDGEEKRSLQNYAKHLQVSIHWLPYTKNPRLLSAYYTAADVYAHPAKNETFGLSVLESLACGTPVVAFSKSGLDESARLSATSRLVKEGDVPGFAAAIEAALSYQTTFAERVANHQFILKERSLEDVANKQIQTYRNIRSVSCHLSSIPSHA